MAKQISKLIDDGMLFNFIFCGWYETIGLDNNHPIKSILHDYCMGYQLYIASDKKNHKIVFYRYPNADPDILQHGNFESLNDILRNRSKRSYITLGWGGSVLDKMNIVMSDVENILLTLMDSEQRVMRMDSITSKVKKRMLLDQHDTNMKRAPWQI